MFKFFLCFSLVSIIRGHYDYNYVQEDKCIDFL